MSIICRACLQNVDKDSYFYIDTFDNTQIPNTVPKDCKVNLTYVIYDVAEPTLNNRESPKCIDESKEVTQLEENGEVVLINLTKTLSNGDAESSKTEDKEVLLLSCNECSFVTMEKEKLINHKCMSISTPDKYKCPYCDYSTGRRYRLSYHINAKHTKTNWYDCGQCDYKTTDSSSLRRHQKVVHSVREEGAPLFSCTYCEFHSVSEVALQRHRVSKHGPIIQCCNFCSYQTKDKSNFRKHLYIHGDKPRKCTQCSYQCVSPYQLERHYKKCHV
ncbi:zinc finger protein 64 -like protein, isoforms 3 and 4-like [Asbolus verrucosus]|uniref:Zinc finger protein 64-like protein, isoforms 3 and 4-like n=1 Tax=Asbolus verrucosus TaxID=1661398 RepID=A0A482W710_ASBVE|nr:zinc finger protein 64 -like protein, isoforms 3 and 4-like [Asbolus verrucosus]